MLATKRGGSLRLGSLVIALFVLASLLLPSAAFGALRVFVTSASHDGALGGLAGADGICQTLANNAHLGGTYKAWLSDDFQSASTRFIHSSGPYVLVDGTMIANNWTDLLDGNLAHAIDLDENGSSVSGDVWTGTLSNGTSSSYNCSNWTSNVSDDEGNLGLSSAVNAAWTNVASLTCDNNTYHLYCFQQTTEAVPTMNQWGMIIFMVLAGLGSVYYLRRRKRVKS
jgi:hypothetical protein